MLSSPDEKKKEAIERMQLIGIAPETIKQFENENLVSESVPPLGGIYWINDSQKERIKEFEENNNALVYHVIHNKMDVYGMLYDMECYLFVCDNPAEWETDREDISNGELYVYVYNLTDPINSELGNIGFEVTPAAGLLRKW